jgi:DNA-directed RNA polymerase subunit RPC12/RpoP
MADASPAAAPPEAVCPHCGKTFRPEPLQADAARNAGFKCPHCRLFVALDRAEAPTQPDG